MRHQILDHGYIELVEVWGSDERVVEAARMSTGKGFLGWGDGSDCRYGGVGKEDVVCKHGVHGCDVEHVVGDEKLLKYLWEHRHATPFEMGGAVVEVQAPIFVFREWHRHRTQSYNEMSARYTPLPNVNYVPTVERLMVNSKTNKQAGTVRGADELTTERAESFRRTLATNYDVAEMFYQDALAAGVPKELARVHLPVGRYSRMRASANLRNWLGFLTLRMDKAAQFEIRQYADALCEILREKFPRTIGLFLGERS